MKTAIKVALRNFRREKLYALLNVAGLALGFACCLVLGLYLWSELTYDRHHVNHERIYRVANHFTFADGRGSDLALTGSVLGPMLAEEYPDAIAGYVRFSRGGTNQQAVLRYEDQIAYWDNVFVADDNVFDVFTHDIVYGDPATALDEPSTIAVSRRVAERYFGSENPLGQTLLSEAGTPLTVTLVFEELPENTHLKYDALVAFKGALFQTPEDTTGRRLALSNVNLYTYVITKQGFDARDFDAISAAFYDKHMAEMFRTANVQWRSWLQPLADIHLYSDLEYDFPTGNRVYLYAFATVALFILAVACINYVNLATARAARRARVIGMRKIIGADRKSLVAQFLGESVLFALLATVLGVIAVEVLVTLPPVTALFGKPLELDLFGQPLVAAVIVAFGLAVGVAAGLYPAVYMSSFMPLSALTGRYQGGAGGFRMRETLVFLQFAISIGVIAATLLMGAQMRYVADKALGFDKENRVMITLRGLDLIEREELVATELGKHAGVLGVATAQSMMGGTVGLVTGRAENNEGLMTNFGYNLMTVGDDFIPVMGMELVAGRDFSRRLLTDVGASYVVNETFVNAMGWHDPIGKRIGIGAMGGNEGRVIGVVKDFHFKSLHERIEPFVMFRNPADFSGVRPELRAFQQRLMVVSVAREGMRDTLGYLQEKFAELDPAHPFEYTFVDESLERLYVSEERLMRMIGIFAGICIFVACLGLFGLSAFTTEQRTKEIGIRKVLGASAAEIVLLLSQRVLVLVGASAVLASIVTWVAMQEWLSGFAYRAALNPLYFVAAALGAGAVALLTIALQSWRIARADPVGALRYE